MLNAFIYSGLRTPIGRHGGKLASVRPDDLAATVIGELVARSKFSPEQIEDVVLGCASQSGEDSRNVARHAALISGLPAKVPGQTVNRLCGSGLAAVIDAARAVTCGEGQLYLAGGVESMTRAPFVVGKNETPFGRDFQVFDATIGVRFPNRKLTDKFGNHSMPETADNVANELGISRADCDHYAAQSQARYAAAKASGFYAGEILPIEVSSGRKGAIEVVGEDEHPRPESNYESLSKLRTLFPGGVVTAGNASGINDGAAALLIGNAQVGERVGMAPMARILSSAVFGVEPRVMGVGPAYAIPVALARAGLMLNDMDVIEINEAFSAQLLGCLKLLEIPFDDPRVNPNGGAIALGHPLGASGARITLSAARELHRRNATYAVVSLCIGVGQGIAMVIERT